VRHGHLGGGEIVNCPSCRRPFESPDHDPFCSSCVDAGWDVAYRRGVEDVRALIASEAEEAAKKHAEHFAKTIAEVRQSFRDMREYCLGCGGGAVHEGARTFWEAAPVSKLTGKCTVCHKPRKAA